MWDNLLWILLLNCMFLIIVCGGGLIYLKVNSNGILKGTIFFLNVYLLFVFIGGSSSFLSGITNGNNPRIQDMIEGFRKNTVSGLFLAIFIFIFSFFLSYAFPFYYSLKNSLGYFLIFIVSWILIITVYTLLYYFPAAARFKNGAHHDLKKSFFIFTENIGYTLFLTAVSISIAILSAFTGYLIPGFTCILLLWNVGVKIIADKETYLMKNPEATHRPVPWEDILQLEIDRLGKRTLRGTIFPWKS
jgi:hypothetical protein